MRTIKTWLATIAVLLCSITANAHDFWVNGIYYDVTSNTEVSVTYRGNSYNASSNEYSGNVVIPSTVRYSGKEYSVTSIGDYAFYNSSGLTSVTIPNSVTSIGSYAFYGCSGLISVTIPNSVTSIGRSTFCNCSSLASVTIPNSVTSIGNGAFSGCSGLTSVTIPNSVTSIGSYAFYGCSGLISVTIPNSVTSIGSEAFQYCSRLTSVTIPNSVESIGDYAFWGCSSLRKVLNFSKLNISKGSDGYGYVGYYAHLVLNNPEIIDNYVFAPNGNTYALYGYMGTDTNLQLPEKYKGENYVIGDYAFCGCFGLTSVTIPNSVTSIGSDAFSGCNLKNLIIGTGVLSIGSNQSKPTKVIWLTNTPPNRYANLAGTINYVANDNYTQLSNMKVYKYLSSYFEVDGIVYVPVNPSARTCDAISCSYDSTATSISIDETVSYKGIAMSVENVMPYTAYRQTSVKTLSLSPKSDIGDYAFYGCTGITNATISNEGNIGTSAFEGAMSAANVTLNVTNKGDIGNNAFSGCTGVTRVTISNEGNIGTNAFYGCTGITNATISNEGNIGTSAFEGAMRSANGTLNVTNKGDIYNRAFYGCTGITNATISNEGNIGTSAFERAMQSSYATLKVTIPGVIEDRGFYCCTNLRTAEINIVGEEDTEDTEDNSAPLTFDDWTSTNTAHGSVSSKTYTFTVQGESTLSFDWWVSSENGYDKLIVTLDGSTILEKSGDTTSGTFTKTVGSGSHTLVVKYSKDNSDSRGQDKAKVSNIKVVSGGASASLSIGHEAFRVCDNLSSITLGDSIKSIGDYAFYGCLKLAEVTIPNKTISLGEYCFSGNSLLANIDLGNGLKTIGQYCFSGCSMPEISIPASVTSIGNYTFNNCCSLADVVIEDRTSELTLGSNGSSPLFASCPLDSVYIGGKIKYNTSSSSGYSPFYRNTSLRTIVITDEEEEIYNNEFYGCTNLKNVTMGDGVKKIGNWAFSGCSNLDYFNFGSGMQSIGDEAFSDCTNLTMLISYAQVPPTCGSMSLDDINKWECVLKIPQNSLSAYQAADQWKEFFFIEDVLTGINEIEAETEGDAQGDVRGDVYSLNGTLLKRNVNVNRLNSILPAGLYVVNGKKVVVK